MQSCKAIVTVYNKDDQTDSYELNGVYYGDGRVECLKEGIPLAIDPDVYNDDDPKRMFRPDTNRWTRWIVRSLVLDPKALKKEVKTP
jgi:hypothetical protein